MNGTETTPPPTTAAQTPHRVYHAFVDSMSFCKTCGEQVVLLCPKGILVDGKLGEGFYICFRCFDIAQIAVPDKTIIKGLNELRRRIHGDEPPARTPKPKKKGLKR